MEELSQSNIEIDEESSIEEEENHTSSNEDENESEEENNLSQDISQNRKKNKMGIDFETEKNYWSSYFIKKFVYMPTECHKCKQKNISLGNTKNILHPFNIICNDYKCRYRMRITKYSFLEKKTKIPCTIIMKTIEKFLFDWSNVTIIYKYIKAYYYPINISTIHNY